MEVEQYNFERDILNSLILAAAVCNFFPFKKSQKKVPWLIFFVGDPSGTGNRWKLTLSPKEKEWLEVDYFSFWKGFLFNRGLL